jgi:hypothetical protein
MRNSSRRVSRLSASRIGARSARPFCGLQRCLLFPDPLTQFPNLGAAVGGEEGERQFPALLRQPPALVDHGLDVPDFLLEADDLGAHCRHRPFELGDLPTASLLRHRGEQPALTQAVEFLGAVTKDRLLFQQCEPCLLATLVVQGDPCSSSLVALGVASLELGIPLSHLGVDVLGRQLPEARLGPRPLLENRRCLVVLLRTVLFHPGVPGRVAVDFDDQRPGTPELLARGGRSRLGLPQQAINLDNLATRDRSGLCRIGWACHVVSSVAFGLVAENRGVRVPGGRLRSGCDGLVDHLSPG